MIVYPAENPKNLHPLCRVKTAVPKPILELSAVVSRSKLEARGESNQTPRWLYVLYSMPRCVINHVVGGCQILRCG